LTAAVISMLLPAGLDLPAMQHVKTVSGVQVRQA
jgi:hypothetical protein